MRDTDHSREKRRKTIIGVFIAAVMVLSTFGFVLEYSTNSGSRIEQYNGIKFEASGQQVVAKINGELMRFDYFPSQVNTISIDKDAVNLLRTAPAFYFTNDPYDTYAANTDEVALFVSENAPKFKQVYPVLAFTNTSGVPGTARPQMTCANATAAFPVIYIHRGNATAITLDGDCIDMSAYAPADIYRLGDRLAYILLGVTDA